MKGFSVAFIGPDGAGKSTITRHVVGRLGPQARRLYMGVNLEEANVALPTTKLVLMVKRSRGGRPDLSAWPTTEGTRRRRLMRDTARIVNLIAEEWYRAIIAGYHQSRGRVVIMDRHFLADYWKHDISPDDPSTRSVLSRVHGFLLRKLYPRPDRMIFLDAPAQLLLERKSEATEEYLVRRREEYAELGRSLGTVVRVDTDRPLSDVVDACVDIVEQMRLDR